MSLRDVLDQVCADVCGEEPVQIRCMDGTIEKFVQGWSIILIINSYFNLIPGDRGKSKFEKVKVWRFPTFSRIEHVCKS